MTKVLKILRNWQIKGKLKDPEIANKKAKKVKKIGLRGQRWEAL